MLKAIVNLFDAEAAPADLMHGEEAAGRLVDVHDAVCADCVLVHEPAQLDERVGLLQSRAACHATSAGPISGRDGRGVPLRRATRAPGL